MYSYKYHAYIIYKRDTVEMEYAERIWEYLEAHELNPWYDERNLGRAVLARREMENALNQSLSFIIILGPGINCLKGKECTCWRCDEFDLAVNIIKARGVRTLIPVALPGIDIDEIQKSNETFLKLTTFVHFEKDKTEKSLEDLLDTIKAKERQFEEIKKKYNLLGEIKKEIEKHKYILPGIHKDIITNFQTLLYKIDAIRVYNGEIVNDYEKTIQKINEDIDNELKRIESFLYNKWKYLDKLRPAGIDNEHILKLKPLMGMVNIKTAMKPGNHTLPPSSPLLKLEKILPHVDISDLIRFFEKFSLEMQKISFNLLCALLWTGRFSELLDYIKMWHEGKIKFPSPFMLFKFSIMEIGFKYEIPIWKKFHGISFELSEYCKIISKMKEHSEENYNILTIREELQSKFEEFTVLSRNPDYLPVGWSDSIASLDNRGRLPLLGTLYDFLDLVCDDNEKEQINYIFKVLNSDQHTYPCYSLSSIISEIRSLEAILNNKYNELFSSIIEEPSGIDAVYKFIKYRRNATFSVIAFTSALQTIDAGLKADLGLSSEDKEQSKIDKSKKTFYEHSMKKAIESIGKRTHPHVRSYANKIIIKWSKMISAYADQ
ncbi:MAG: TIR domain-containing protein [Desulfobacterales bacterium]|nr:TIR domain-containing protein [Desulfobacterales bacterium]